MKRHAPKDDDAKNKILARVRSVEGHVRAVADMIASDVYCVDVLQQTLAVRAAISKVESMLLERHLHHCVTRAVHAGDKRAREKAFAEVLELFDATRRMT